MMDEKEQEETNAEVSEQTSVIEELEDNDLAEASGGVINNCLNAVQGCGCG